MKHWEINGNLDNAQLGLANFPQFVRVVCQVKKYFDEVFGVDRLNKIDLLVDNATSNSGHTPIITPILGKYAIIKLGIKSNHTDGKIAFQFAHELTHFVFYTYLGINKPFANDQEETICSAAALIVLKKLYASEFIFYDNCVRSESCSAYRDGSRLAESIGYDINKLKTIIENFHY